MTALNLGFKDLRYVVAVSERRSISRAAEACCITQPALSERIKRIETTLGVKLFERNKQKLSVTPVGQEFVLKAQKLLDDAAALDEIVVSSSIPLAGPFRVGVIATIGPYLMPLLLPSLQSEYPNLQLILQEGLTDGLIGALQAGSLDVVIASAPLHAPGIDHLKLFDEPFILAIPIEHELAKRRSIFADDLSGDDMVLLEDGHCLSGQALDVCPAKQRLNRNRLHAMSLETLRHMVASGAGYTLMPSLAVGPNPPLRKLIRYMNIGGEHHYGRTIVLAWRHSFTRTADIELFARLIRQSLPAYL
jgi:LysR family hydrogen peroxide-inducible transcriptional activator